MLGLALARPAGAEESGSYAGSFGNWEAHIYRLEGGETRCALRALHPAILEAEVFWVFNTRHAARLPDGYLALDRRVADGAAGLAAVVDGGPAFALRIGEDGFGYNRDADAGRLIAAMRRGLSMAITVERRTAARQVLTVSLLGFTRGTDAMRRACAG